MTGHAGSNILPIPLLPKIRSPSTVPHKPAVTSDPLTCMTSTTSLPPPPRTTQLTHYLPAPPPAFDPSSNTSYDNNTENATQAHQAQTTTMLDILFTALQGFMPGAMGSSSSSSVGGEGVFANPLFSILRVVALTFLAGLTPMIVSRVRTMLYDGECGLGLGSRICPFCSGSRVPFSNFVTYCAFPAFVQACSFQIRLPGSPE